MTKTSRRLADHATAAQVCKILPKIDAARDWRVEIVGRPDDAGVHFQSKTVRIHELWREAVYNAGLHSVTLHHPLSLEPTEIRDERMTSWRDQGFRLWRAITIKRQFRGRFTGRFSVAHAFVVRTSDGLSACAHEDCVIAARRALSFSRSKRHQEDMSHRALASFRNEIRELLSSRLNFKHAYPFGHHVSFRPYQTLLPQYLVNTLTHHGGRTVPLADVERQSIDAVLSMERKDIADLLYQLDSDIFRAASDARPAPSVSGPAPTRSLDYADEDALELFRE